MNDFESSTQNIYILDKNRSTLDYVCGNGTIFCNTTLTPRSTPVSSATMFTFGVIGNICAIIVIWKSSTSHKWKAFYRYVFLLAITDLLGILTLSPVTLNSYINNRQWIGGQPLCDFFGYQMAFSGLATVLIAAAMSVDRFMGVYFPYFYTHQIKNSPRRINYILCIIWIFSVFVGLAPVFGFGKNKVQFPGTWCFFEIRSNHVENNVFSCLYASAILLAIFVMAVCNIMVICFLKRESAESVHINRRKASICSSKSSRKRNDRYIIIFLVAIFVVFCACWTPFMVYIFVAQSVANTNGHIVLTMVRIASLNQILDPWVYILLRKENLVKFQTFCIRTKNRTCTCKCQNLHFIKAPCIHTSLDSHSQSQSGL